jgi:hypothetical protein
MVIVKTRWSCSESATREPVVLMFKVHLLEKNATCLALNALMFTAT